MVLSFNYKNQQWRFCIIVNEIYNNNKTKILLFDSLVSIYNTIQQYHYILSGMHDKWTATNIKEIDFIQYCAHELIKSIFPNYILPNIELVNSVQKRNGSVDCGLYVLKNI